MAQAEASKPPSFGLALSGFIKTDILYDSRQTVNVREGHYLLFPKGEMSDRDGLDLNAVPTFHLLSIQTRLLGRIAGPDAFGAKTSGLVEGEFFGTSDGDLNGFRLRHAFVKLDWPNTGLLVGQYWHPMFVVECSPEVVSFNTGAPFQPFNRSPQVRLTWKFGNWSLSATAMSQRDFVSPGPDGPSPAYARNAARPEFNLKLQGVLPRPAGGETVFGLAANQSTIRPRVSTQAGYKSDETLSAWAGMAFGKFRTRAVTVKAEAVYGGNLHHLTMLGGYAVERATDVGRGLVRYRALRTLALWGEISTNGPAVQAGLLAGWAKNGGAGVDLAGPTYARGADIDSLFRLSPRLLVNSGKVRAAAEVEWTGARYGLPTSSGKVAGGRLVGNVRLLGAVYYFF
jgi:hypothetical protein